MTLKQARLYPDIAYKLKIQAAVERSNMTELVNRVLREYLQRQSGPDLRHTAAASDPINGDGHSSI